MNRGHEQGSWKKLIFYIWTYIDVFPIEQGSWNMKRTHTMHYYFLGCSNNYHTFALFDPPSKKWGILKWSLQKRRDLEGQLPEKLSAQTPISRWKRFATYPYYQTQTKINTKPSKNKKTTTNKHQPKKKHMSQPEYIKKKRQHQTTKPISPPQDHDRVLPDSPRPPGLIWIGQLAKWWLVPLILHYWVPVTFQGKTHCCLTSGAGR